MPAADVSFERPALAASPLLFAAFVALTLTATVAGAAAEVAWQRRGNDPTCAPQNPTPTFAAATVACGSYGTFTFGPSAAGAAATDWTPAGAGNCQEQVVEAIEEPRVVPGEVAFAPSVASWRPCDGGSCFTAAPTAPWVAVVDWHNHHGWTVGATILQAADRAVSVALFDLGSFSLPGADPAETSDLQLIAQLCRVVTMADAGHAPLLVNLSLGRAGAQWPCAEGPSLGCEVAGLIDHLSGQGVATVAAAGNHGEALFPAVYPGTLAVGALDVSHSAATGQAQRSALTPAGTAALFPGYGLVLEDPASGRVYPLAAGTSYAAAIASGWLARYGAADRGRLNGLLGRAPFADLAPVETTDGFTLKSAGLTLADARSQGGAALLRTALGRRPELFPGGDGAGTRIVTVWDLPIGIGWQHSLVRSAAALNRPSPDAEPCVPCRLRRPRRAPVATPTPSHEVLILELARSGGLPADRELTGMYLRIDGEDYVAINMLDPQLLADLRAGRLVEIEVVIARERLSALQRRPVSLRWAMRWVADGRTFWDATPVVVHLDP